MGCMEIKMIENERVVYGKLYKGFKGDEVIIIEPFVSESGELYFGINEENGVKTVFGNSTVLSAVYLKTRVKALIHAAHVKYDGKKISYKKVNCYGRLKEN